MHRNTGGRGQGARRAAAGALGLDAIERERGVSVGAAVVSDDDP